MGNPVPMRDRARAAMQPGSEIRPFIEWPTRLGLQVVQVRRNGASIGSDTQYLTQYLKHLERLGLADPTPASELWARSRMLSAQAREVRAADPRDQLAGDLASGKIAPEDLAKALRKQPDRAAATAAVVEQRSLLDRGAGGALLAALQSIFDHTEASWLELLRPLVDRAVRDGDDVGWDEVHMFAAVLRDPRHARLAGLAAVVDRNRLALDFDPYAFRRPDRVYRWRVERATDLQRRELSKYQNLGVWCQAWSLKPHAPRPRLADFEPSWGAGIYSAEQAIENVHAASAAQEDAIAKLAASAPEDRRRRAVFT